MKTVRFFITLLVLATNVLVNPAECEPLKRFCIMADLNGDSEKELVMLKEIPNVNSDNLEKEAELFIKCKNKVYRMNIGFLWYWAFDIEIARISDRINPFIKIETPAGIHGSRVFLYGFNGGEINKEIEVFSDAGNIKIYDIDQDGDKEIISYDRDYDNNSTEDSYIKTYKYINKKWECISAYRTRTNKMEAVYD